MSSRSTRVPAGQEASFQGPWEYEPSLEGTDSVGVAASYGLFIGGELREPSSGGYFTSVNPATGQELAQFASAGEDDVDLAVASARHAFEDIWSATPPAERAKCLFRIARILAERSKEFAVAETLDNGKPIRESRDVDVPLAVGHFSYYAGWADKLEWAGFPGTTSPVGVAAQVIPWNFPLLMLAWKVAPALACGNTVVLKPAETTSLTALMFADVCRQAGVPAGVVNIITGAGDVGRALVAHPGVDKVAFTGSTEVGKEIARALAGTRKRLTLELGGKGANIVFDDAALDEAVEGVVRGIFFNQGHVCCAGSRLVVQESVADEVLSRLKSRMSLLRVGNPLDKNTDVGAINSPEQLGRISRLCDAAESAGAVRWSATTQLPLEGNWFSPTILTGVASSDRIAREEVFGPVLSVLTFRTPEEAVAIANATPYGLACGVWTDKGSKASWVASRLNSGVVWTNTYNVFDPSSPFGGFGESGYGREGGIAGLEPYLTVKEAL